MLKKILAVMGAAVLLMTAGCGGNENVNDNENNTQEEQSGAPENTGDVYADKINFTIEMADGGIMKGELYPDLAPKTVENFVSLCESKFYDGLIFHRVMPGFMIQGGGYDENMNEKKADTITGEFSSNGFENPLKHERGVISMARTQDPNSASSQFFIMHDAAPHLDGEYAAFGKITEGLDIVDEIANVETTTYQEVMENVPVEPQIIKTITIDK